MRSCVVPCQMPSSLPFVVHSHGRLRWHRQAMNDSFVCLTGLWRSGRSSRATRHESPLGNVTGTISFSEGISPSEGCDDGAAAGSETSQLHDPFLCLTPPAAFRIARSIPPQRLPRTMRVSSFLPYVTVIALRLYPAFAEDRWSSLPVPNAFWWHPGGPSSNETSDDHSCASHTTCTSCNAASLCHWCDSDQACHVMGSIHGCLRGSDCSPPPPPKPPNNDSCAAHTSCTDCTLHSRHMCHWCAHDNACHAMGSVYGCVAGVDCYSNERCQRRESEPLIHGKDNETEEYYFFESIALEISQIGFFPLTVLVVLAMSCVCCVSLCYCVSANVKGAYDDLVAVYEDEDDDHPNGPRVAHRRQAVRPSAEAAPMEEEPVDVAEQGDRTPTSEYVPLGEGSDHNAEEEGPDEQEDHPIDRRGWGDGAEQTNDDMMTSPLLMQRRRRPRPRHMQRLFNYCRLCYVLTLMTIFACSIATILYYPKIPTYNVCNDAVAWSSLIESLTNMKATADFEILVSVSNPNHFSLALDKGMGSFTHKGTFVGTYDIPPTVAAPMAITDLLIVAHLAPDKWDALGLVAEYYRGKLVLYVDAEATLRIPMLANYSFTTALRNIVVNVNEQSERYLCACPNWKDIKLPVVNMEDLDLEDVDIVQEDYMVDGALATVE